MLKSINLKLKSNISICQDLTEFERNRHKLLLTERKKLNDELKLKDNYSEIGFYYGIRRNAVIKIDKIINQWNIIYQHQNAKNLSINSNCSANFGNFKDSSYCDLVNKNINYANYNSPHSLHQKLFLSYIVIY